MNLISVSEGFKLAEKYPGVPSSLRGFSYLGKRVGFIISKKHAGDVYRKQFCDKKKLQEFFKYIKSHLNLTQMAEGLQKTPGSIFLKLQKLSIFGEQKYGKVYYQKKEYRKILNYYENKRNRKKETRKGKNT